MLEKTPQKTDFIGVGIISRKQENQENQSNTKVYKFAQLRRVVASPIYKTIEQSSAYHTADTLIEYLEKVSHSSSRQDKDDAVLVLNKYLSKAQEEYRYEADHVHTSSLASALYNSEQPLEDLFDAVQGIRKLGNNNYGGREAVKLLMGMQHKYSFNQGIAYANKYSEAVNTKPLKDRDITNMISGVVIGGFVTLMVCAGVKFFSANKNEVSLPEKHKTEYAQKQPVHKPE